ncbi:MAG: hypothetical protein AAF968_08360 [Pseudomonadota bacterium]
MSTATFRTLAVLLPLIAPLLAAPKAEAALLRLETSGTFAAGTTLDGTVDLSGVDFTFVATFDNTLDFFPAADVGFFTPLTASFQTAPVTEIAIDPTGFVVAFQEGVDGGTSAPLVQIFFSDLLGNSGFVNTFEVFPVGFDADMPGTGAFATSQLFAIGVATTYATLDQGVFEFGGIDETTSLRTATLTAVPLPGGLALLAVGLGALLIRRGG